MTDRNTDDGYRPPSDTVAHMDPTANWDGFERRCCPNCRLYFDAAEDSDAVFCSNACRRRHERGELKADGGQNRETMAVLMIGEVPHGLFPDSETAEEWATQHDRVDESKAQVWWPIPVRPDGGWECARCGSKPRIDHRTRPAESCRHCQADEWTLNPNTEPRADGGRVEYPEEVAGWQLTDSSRASDRRGVNYHDPAQERVYVNITAPRPGYQKQWVAQYNPHLEPGESETIHTADDRDGVVEAALEWMEANPADDDPQQRLTTDGGRTSRATVALDTAAVLAYGLVTIWLADKWPGTVVSLGFFLFHAVAWWFAIDAYLDKYGLRLGILGGDAA